MQVILGTEGNQPFKIKGEAVSRKHAQITTNQYNEWFLEDLDSLNGTFVRQESNGELTRVGKIQITPMTFICLGPDNAKGCSFYARQVLKEYTGNYKEEYDYLNDIEDRYDQKFEDLERTILNEKKLIFAINILVVIVSLIPQIDSEIRMNMLRIVPTISAGFAAFYDAGGKKKRLNEERNKFHDCPNPTCSNKLRTSEIRNMRCSKCKK